MNSQLVSRIEEVTRSRLVTIHAHTVLTEVAALMSSTQISLVVVCDADGAMVARSPRPTS